MVCKQKRLISALLALIMALSLLTAMPITAQAASAFDFIRDGNGNRIGINSIVINGVTYYDIYAGDAVKGKQNSGNNLMFFRDALLSKDNTAGNASALDYWSQLAYLVFSDNSYVTSHINASGGFDENMGKRPNQAGYMDLVNDLQRTSSGRSGSVKNDTTSWTSLSYATSLQDVRGRMAQTIADCIDRKTTADNVLSSTGDSTYPALGMMDEDTKGDVFYSIVTGVDRVGATYQYYYNSYGIAFYDFQISVIADAGLEYITAAEGFDSVQAAAGALVPGVTYEQLGSSNPMISYYTNSAGVPADVSMEFKQENTTTVSNSMTTTESYSFREMIGSETKFKAGFPLIGEAEQTIKLEFSAEQAFSTAWTEEKSVSNTTSNTVATTLTLPAHSVIGIESSDGTVKVTLDYDCPIAISYKVAIFSLAGCCYDDGAATKSFSTAGYVQSHFCSILGDATGDARSDLYNRVFKNKEMSSYDEALGTTIGWRKRRSSGFNPDMATSINWPVLLGEVEEAKSDVGFTIEYYEVKQVADDPEGEPAYTLVSSTPFLTVSDTGVAKYEKPITATTPLAFSGFDIDLITDSVYVTDARDADGYYTDPLDNAFASGQTKLLYLSPNPDDNVVCFYYEAPPGESPLTGSPTGGSYTADSPTPAQPTDKKATSVWANVVDTSDLANWLCMHQPMSATGGTMSFTSNSMNANINDIVALYPLTQVKLTDGKAQYNMIEGDNLDLDDLAVQGYNWANVPYYGFDQDYGHWILTDADGVALSSSSIASLTETDQLTGKTYLVAGGVEGTVYLKYVINDKTYQSHTSVEYASDTDPSFSAAYVRINTTVKPFTGRIEAKGSLIGYEGESVQLNASPSLEAHVFDETDMEIDAAIAWEKQYLNGLTITGGTLTFDSRGDYKIRATYQKKWSEWVDVKVLEARKLDLITISKDNTNLLDDYILHDGLDQFDLNLLDVYAENQYGTAWTDFSGLTWRCDKGTINASGILTVNEAGLHTIWAECGGEKSNELTLNVLPARSVTSIVISGAIPLLDINNLGSGHSFDLNGLTVEALDQHGDPISLSAPIWEIVAGDEYASLTGSIIEGWIQGSGEVRLTDGNAVSNTLPFYVGSLPYVNELYYIDGAEYVIEGADYDLTNVILAARDQWGNPYSLTTDQMSSLIWTVSAEGGTVANADITLTGSTVKVETGAVEYAGTGTALLTAKLPDRGDGNPSEAFYVTLKVRQAPVCVEITIGLADESAVLLEKQNSLVSDYFTVSALDQYGEDYPINTDDVDWDCDNIDAFSFSKINGQLTITADKENESAGIQASLDVEKYGCDPDNYALITQDTVKSNTIQMSIPAPRRVTSIIVTGAPAVVAFGSKLNVNTLIPSVYDQLGVAFSSAELTNYPAKINYSIDADITGTTFNAVSGVISFGNTSGTVILTAMVVNTSSNKLAETAINIKVEPTAPTPTPTPTPNPRPNPNPSSTQYTVTFDSKGGSEVSRQSISSGGKVTEPEDPIKEGFDFAGWHSDEAMTTLYDFDKAVTGNITLYAMWMASDDVPLTWGNPFIDVSEDDWFYDDVGYVYINGLMNGTAENLFSPNANLTRAMIVTILYRLEGEPSIDDALPAIPFDDLASGAYYMNAVIWGEQNGIVLGYGNGNFGPNDPITREQLAAILLRYMNFKEIYLAVTAQWIVFADEADIYSYAMDAIQMFYKIGVINGTGENANGQAVINPKGNATRAQAAAMFHRFMLAIE